jgi:signal transduction histidine kinase
MLVNCRLFPSWYRHYYLTGKTTADFLLMKKILAYFLQHYKDEPFAVKIKTRVLIKSNITCVAVLLPIICMHILSGAHLFLISTDLLFICLMLGPFFLVRKRNFEAAANLVIAGVAFVIIMQNPFTDILFDTPHHYNRCLETAVLFMAAIVLVGLFAYQSYQLTMLVSIAMAATLVHYLIIIERFYGGEHTAASVTFIITYLFIMFLAGLLSKFMLGMYKKIITIAEKESHKVKLANQNLELKVAERTRELEVQNEELKKVNSELDRFVYSVSHDLRAPLLSTLGLIDISRQEKDEQEKYKYLELMHKSIRKLDNFIVDIINLSKNARLELHSEQIDFNKLIQSVLDEHSFIDPSRSIEFRKEIHQAGGFCTDSKRLLIILNNLVSNAIRYSRLEKPFVKIQVRADAKEAVIEVTDNGIGIAQVHQEKIFNMFYRASQNKSGSGLGLYIVRETVQKLKGTVQVQSQVDKGSTFLLHLPSLTEAVTPEKENFDVADQKISEQFNV